MAWLAICKSCGYRVLAKKKEVAEKFIDIHQAKSQCDPTGEYEILFRRIPDEDYEIMKQLPSMPVLIV